MTPSPADDELLKELVALFREVDEAYAGATCPASTECCRFGLTGREPYVTSIEWLSVQRAISKRGGALSKKRRALPLSTGGRDERTCPLLDIDGRCSVYADRPFGCRTYFCERATIHSGPTRSDQRAFVSRLRDIAARHRPRGDAPRPLSRAYAIGNCTDWG